MRETADVVVIGGGSTGSSVAWHLARAGLTVRLLERGTIASGSSGDSPGIVRQYYPNPRWLDSRRVACGFTGNGPRCSTASAATSVLVF